jgi:hypothetical protein
MRSRGLLSTEFAQIVDELNSPLFGSRRQIQINPWPSQTALLSGWPPSVVLEETGEHPGTRTHGWAIPAV